MTGRTGTLHHIFQLKGGKGERQYGSQRVRLEEPHWDTE